MPLERITPGIQWCGWRLSASMIAVGRFNKALSRRLAGIPSGFAADSPLEGTRFEPWSPLATKELSFFGDLGRPHAVSYPGDRRAGAARLRKRKYALPNPLVVSAEPRPACVLTA